jgi:hypothetical protein
MTECSDDNRKIISVVWGQINFIADSYGGVMDECGYINRPLSRSRDLFGDVRFQ